MKGRVLAEQSGQACKLGLFCYRRVAYLWCRRLAPGDWSWVRQLGHLAVYIGYVDLVRPWLAKYRQHLNVPSAGNRGGHGRA
jgi:hypothetical protein